MYGWYNYSYPHSTKEKGEKKHEKNPGINVGFCFADGEMDAVDTCGRYDRNTEYDGIAGKIAMIGEDSQLRLQETMQKIVNDSTGGFICIII